MESFYKHMRALIESIEDCLKKHRILPCLVLLYSGIDVIASMEAKSGKGVQESFTRWVDRYLLKAYSFEFNAVDLYAGRCAIVHTFTPDSRLSQKGHARILIYAWGAADLTKLKKASSILGRNDLVHVHIRELVDAFRQAIANYLEEVEASPERQQKFEKAASRWFLASDTATLDNFLALHA